MSDFDASSRTLESRTKGHRSLLGFALRFWKPQWRAALLSLTLMVLSGCLSLLIPFAAREVASYDGGSEPNPINTTHTSLRTPANGHQALLGSSFGGGHVRKVLGQLAEALFGRTASALMRMLPTRWLTLELAEDEVFLWGLVVRCCLMGAAVVGYHVVSLCGHLMAYRAGAGAQSALVYESVCAILASPFPERIAVVNPAHLTHTVITSARKTGDMLAALLTDVVSSFLGAVTLLGAMLYISVTLTILIGVLVLSVQYIYYMAGHAQHARATAASHHEAVVQATVSNAIQRSETVYVFHCRAFILNRLQETLTSARRVNDALNVSIHGYACASTSSTTLIFVVVLGISSFLHRKGDLDLMDIGLYFMFVQQFVSRLLQLAQDVSRMRVDLGRLETLRCTLAWYSHDADSDDGADEERKTAHEGPVASSSPTPSTGTRAPLPYTIVLEDTPSAPIGLEDVTFYYPTVPTFITAASSSSASASAGPLSPSVRNQADDAQGGAVADSISFPANSNSATPEVPRGIRHFSVSVAAGTITALYGPSGCGKSTCLRLLAGLVRPHEGTVRTHKHTLLLEQQHAIFLGSIAENILLEDLSSSPAQRSNDPSHEERVRTAMTKGGCADFIKDPFHSYVENVDTPAFSGGQLQRICLSRIFDPQRMTCSLALLDEPTTGLDAVSAAKLLVTIQELRDTFHKTVLIATHDERVAQISDTVIHLSPA